MPKYLPYLKRSSTQNGKHLCHALHIRSINFIENPQFITSAHRTAPICAFNPYCQLIVLCFDTNQNSMTLTQCG